MTLKLKNLTQINIIVIISEADKYGKCKEKEITSTF